MQKGPGAPDDLDLLHGSHLMEAGLGTYASPDCLAVRELNQAGDLAAQGSSPFRTWAISFTARRFPEVARRGREQSLAR
jgi:hypothetical protein